MYDTTRTATVIALEDMVVGTIKRRIFKEHVKKVKTQAHLEKVVEVLKKIEAFQGFSEHHLVKIAAKSQVFIHPSNSLLVAEGSEPRFVFFLLNGRVKITKKVLFLSNQGVDDLRDPTEEQISEGRCKMREIEIGELEEASWLGEESTPAYFASFLLLLKPICFDLLCRIPE